MKSLYKILYFLKTLSFILIYVSKVSSSEFIDTGYAMIGDYYACVFFKSVEILDNGYAKLKFVKTSDTNCKNAKINFAKTHPEKQIRGVFNLNKNGTFGETFSITVTPETNYIGLSTLNQGGNDGTADFRVDKSIKSAQEIVDNKNWMTNFNASESKLEETKALDKTSPSIQLLSPSLNQNGQFAKVDTYTTFIRGKASDDVGVMNILVQGKKVNTKEDGSFAAKVKLAFGRNDILIQAEDINGNISEKTITIIREEFISEQTLADVDLPPKTKMNNPDALAVVIGIENYQYVPDASFAYNDAEVFREYLADTLGFKKQRIKIAANSKATQAEFSKLLGSNGWLARNVVNGKSDIVVYFSGHGIASQKDNLTGILPFDVDPNYAIGLSMSKLYQDLASMGARSITVYLDACFTGQTREKNMLIADARPIIIVPKLDAIPSNMTVLSAASSSQISGALKEKEHGLFTYYVLKGLGGEADSNKDNNINVTELNEYVSMQVQLKAAMDGREQTPELQGDANRVLVRFQ